MRIHPKAGLVFHVHHDRLCITRPPDLDPDDPYSLDVETAGLDYHAPLRTVQVARDDHAWVFTPPVRIRFRPRYTHNGIYDAVALRDPGILTPPLVDTYLLARLTQPDQPAALKQLAARLGLDTTAAERHRPRDWTTVPVTKLAHYGAADAILTGHLAHILLNHTGPDTTRHYRTELHVARIMAACTIKGIRVDLPLLDTLIADHQQKIEHLTRHITEEWGINPGSNRSVAEILAADGWTPAGRTPTGKPRLRADDLAAIDHPLAAAVLDHRRTVKRLSTYLIPFRQAATKDGRIHALYDTFKAITGRMAASTPPVQQIPRTDTFRNLFVAEAGHTIITADYSGIEMRLAAALSGEPTLIDAYRNGQDPYQILADTIATDRHTAKTVLLATLYGAGPNRIASVLHTTPDTANSILRQLHTAMPVLHHWTRNTTGAPVVKTITGRTVIPRSPHAAVNALIQGSAADVLKHRLVRADLENITEYLVAVVHDEIVLEVPDRHVEDVVHWCTTRLPYTYRDVTIPASVTVHGPRWQVK